MDSPRSTAGRRRGICWRSSSGLPKAARADWPRRRFRVSRARADGSTALFCHEDILEGQPLAGSVTGSPKPHALTGPTAHVLLPVNWAAQHRPDGLTAAILPPETLASWGLINRVIPADRLDREGRGFAQSLASGPTRAHAVTKRVLHAWRSGGVAAADQVTHAEGPAVMLSQDTQEGIASLQRYGPGHANFNNR